MPVKFPVIPLFEKIYNHINRQALHFSLSTKYLDKQLKQGEFLKIINKNPNSWITLLIYKCSNKSGRYVKLRKGVCCDPPQWLCTSNTCMYTQCSHENMIPIWARPLIVAQKLWMRHCAKSCFAIYATAEISIRCFEYTHPLA